MLRKLSGLSPLGGDRSPGMLDSCLLPWLLCIEQCPCPIIYLLKKRWMCRKFIPKRSLAFLQGSQLKPLETVWVKQSTHLRLPVVPLCDSTVHCLSFVISTDPSALRALAVLQGQVSALDCCWCLHLRDEYKHLKQINCRLYLGS